MNGEDHPRPRRASAERRRLYARRRRTYMRRRIVAASVGLIVLVLGIVIIANATSSHHDPRRGPERERGTRKGLVGRAARAASLEAREEAAINKALTYTSFYRRGEPRKREVALTFDDGPGPYTPQILKILRRTKTPATFFVIGEELTYFSKYLREEVRDGFVIGNHTEEHPAMGELGEDEQAAQLEAQARRIRAAGGPTHERLFRPPYLSYNPETLSLLKRKKMLMVLWSVDTDDYELPGVHSIVKTALSGAKPGAVILLHDAGGDRSQTVKALPKIIRGLRRRHLKPVTIPRLILDDPPPHGQKLPDELGGS